jgi:hypothetical protein
MTVVSIFFSNYPRTYSCSSSKIRVFRIKRTLPPADHEDFCLLPFQSFGELTDYYNSRPAEVYMNYSVLARTFVPSFVFDLSSLTGQPRIIKLRTDSWIILDINVIKTVLLEGHLLISTFSITPVWMRKLSSMFLLRKSNVC